jgi:hypothetical protein
MLAGFRNLIHVECGPDRHCALIRLETMPSALSFQASPKTTARSAVMVRCKDSAGLGVPDEYADGSNSDLIEVSTSDCGIEPDRLGVIRDGAVVVVRRMPSGTNLHRDYAEALGQCQTVSATITPDAITVAPWCRIWGRGAWSITYIDSAKLAGFFIQGCQLHSQTLLRKAFGYLTRLGI